MCQPGARYNRIVPGANDRRATVEFAICMYLCLVFYFEAGCSKVYLNHISHKHRYQEPVL